MSARHPTGLENTGRWLPIPPAPARRYQDEQSEAVALEWELDQVLIRRGWDEAERRAWHQAVARHVRRQARLYQRLPDLRATRRLHKAGRIGAIMTILFIEHWPPVTDETPIQWSDRDAFARFFWDLL